MDKERRALFMKHFSAMYIRVRGSYDIDKNADLFNVIRKQYYDLTAKLPTKHIPDFLNSLEDFHQPKEYRTLLQQYRESIGLIEPQKSEEIESTPAGLAFGKGLCMIMMQQFKQPQFDGDKDLLRALLMCDYYKAWNKCIPKIFIDKIDSTMVADLAEARKYLERYELHRALSREKIELPKPEDFKEAKP